ncbi:MAG TPA: GGDEF domain-containing protein [Burkholderiales bacterium]|nr:GGDEF domain-containing protein [Burkholderiales bacterium]
MAGFSLIPKNNAQQALRLRRYFFALLTSLLVLFFLAVVHIHGYMDWEGLRWSATGMFICIVIFYVLFRSGLNLRFRDPSLTSAQMLSAFFVTTMAAFYIENEARGVILPVLLMIFYFGVYRLDVSRMTTIALITISFYGVMVWMLYLFRPYALDLHLEILRWWILAVVSLWFALMSGHVARLRSELANRKEAIESLLERDDLTGVGNRRFLTHMLEQEKSRADRTGITFCVAMLDLDYFKKVNDSYGHMAGDEVLKVFAQIAQQELRKIDYFGRHGGEEFMLIMPETRLDGAQVKAERLRSNVENVRFHDIDPALIQTVSIGIAEYQRGESIEQIQQRADKALYAAKSNGRNRVEIDAEDARDAAVDARPTRVA